MQGLVGGYITANATSTDDDFAFTELYTFDGAHRPELYAFDGAHRLATTMFPATNSHRTINGKQITWTATTTAILSIDGATSKRTTTSASIGVGGSTQTTTLSGLLATLVGRPA